jgi:hypothetical protein
MEAALKQEIKTEINRIVDLNKDIKNEYGIPIPTITKVVTILRKQNLEEEEQKWEEIKEFVDICS